MTEYKAIKVNGVKVDEHRYIMEQQLGRKLTRYEVVHHKNGDKRDNRIDNLEVMTLSDHTRSHMIGTKLSDSQKDKISKRMMGNTLTRGLTDEEVNTVRELREQGLSYAKIADIVGSNKWTVGKIIRGVSYIEDVV